MIPTEIRERVARGAELLDRVKPDWFEVVTPERLDMRGTWRGEHGTNKACVLALNYGSLALHPITPMHGLDGLGRYGLIVPEECGSYADLDAAWLEEADRRRAATP